LSSHAKVTAWHHCIQHVTTVQALKEAYGIPLNTA